MSFMQRKNRKKESIDKYIPNKNLIKIINGCYNLPNQEIESQGQDKPTQYNLEVISYINQQITS